MLCCGLAYVVYAKNAPPTENAGSASNPPSVKLSRFEPPPREWYANQYRRLQKTEKLTDQQLTALLMADAESSLTEETSEQRKKSYAAITAMEAFDTPEIRGSLRKLSRQGFSAETRAAALSSLFRLLPPKECLAEMKDAVVSFSGRELLAVIHAVEDKFTSETDKRQKDPYRLCLLLVIDSAVDQHALLHADSVMNRLDPDYAQSERHRALVSKLAPLATGHAPFHMYLRKEARRLDIALPPEAPKD